MTATDTVLLVAGDSRCEIAPALGGSILALSVAGVDLLRPAPPGTRDILDVACLAMLPFANRVAQGRFTFRRRDIVIGVDPAGAPHALHGHGWRRRWTLVDRSGDRAMLACRHDGAGWPWPYRAEQTIVLTPGGLRLDIGIESLHRTDEMPCGVGLHPYFIRIPESRIAGNATARWRNDETGLAVEEVADDRFSTGTPCPVDKLDGTDHFFRSDGGEVTVNDIVRLRGDPVTGFHVYVPAGKDVFCVEPVSHTPNSFGRGEIEPWEAIVAGGRRTWRFGIDHRPGRRNPDAAPIR